MRVDTFFDEEYNAKLQIPRGTVQDKSQNGKFPHQVPSIRWQTKYILTEGNCFIYTWKDHWDIWDYGQGRRGTLGN